MEQVDAKQGEAEANEKQDEDRLSELFDPTNFDGSSTVAPGFQKEDEMLAEEEDKEDNEDWELEVSGLVGVTAVVQMQEQRTSAPVICSTTAQGSTRAAAARPGSVAALPGAVAVHVFCFKAGTIANWRRTPLMQTVPWRASPSRQIRQQRTVADYCRTQAKRQPGPGLER